MMTIDPWKVLIVEDNPLFRHVLKYSLCTIDGVCVVEAEGVAEGRAKVHQEKPDMVVLDINLPDGNGLDLAEGIREELPSCVLGVCTSHDTPEYRQVAAKRGASFFLPKDRLDWDEVIRQVEKARSGARA